MVAKELKRIALRMKIPIFQYIRRLAQPGVLRGSSISEYRPSSQVNSPFGLDYKRGEVRTSTHSGFQIPGVHVRPPQGHSLSTRAEVSSYSGSYVFPIFHPSDHSKTVNVCIGSHGLFREDGPVREALYEAFPGGTKETLGAQILQVHGLEGSAVQVCHVSPSVVVSAPKCDGISAITSTHSIHIHLHGCIDGGVGGSHGRIFGSGCMVTPRVESSHKCVGTRSRPVRVKSFDSTLPKPQGDKGYD